MTGKDDAASGLEQSNAEAAIMNLLLSKDGSRWIVSRAYERALRHLR
jgi:hypothetical protein